MIYCAILFLLVCLSFQYDLNGTKKGRDIWYGIMLMAFILVAGLRWRIGIDTPAYLYNFYHGIPTLDQFSWEDYPIGKDPFFVLINSVVKTIGGRFYLVQLIQATIVNVLIFKFIKKHSRYIFACLFFYAITCYTTYNMEIMRGGLSIVICLFANDYVLEKKWVKAYLLYILALMFHAQTIPLFFLPLLTSLKFNKYGIVCLFGAFLAGIFVSEYLGDYLSLLDLEGDSSVSRKMTAYSRHEKYGSQGGNMNFFIIQIFPILLYVLFSFLHIKKRYPSSHILRYEPFVVLGVMFILIRMNLEIAYRYVDYFKIYFVLFFAEVFMKMIEGNRVKGVRRAILNSSIIFIPFILVFFVYNYVLSDDYSFRYTPYSSVISRTVSEKRESMYQDLNAGKLFFPGANVDEY